MSAGISSIPKILDFSVAKSANCMSHVKPFLARVDGKIQSVAKCLLLKSVEEVVFLILSP